MRELSMHDIKQVSGGYQRTALPKTEYSPISLDAIYIKPHGADDWLIVGTEPYIPVNLDDSSIRI